MQKIMIIDDEIDILSMLDRYFRLNGYSVITADSAAEAQNKLSLQPDLILLDINMPEMDGISFCRNIRDYVSCPILFLTANTDDRNKISGFSAGGDDYIVKPFDSKEVVARIKAVLRRAFAPAAETPKEVNFDNLFVSITNYEMKVKGVHVDAPPKELELLFHLASNPNRVFTRDQLLDEVWGYDYYGDSRTVDVHVKRLREKLEGVSDKWELKTVWSVGYKFGTID